VGGNPSTGRHSAAQYRRIEIEGDRRLEREHGDELLVRQSLRHVSHLAVAIASAIAVSTFLSQLAKAAAMAVSSKCS
jgi:hypothetical protein